MIECFRKGLIWRGLTHDLSKFLPDEFFPYMNWFYGVCGIKFDNDIWGWQRTEHEECLRKYEIAWLKHIHRNKHHYQYWYLRYDDGTEKYLEIPDKCRKEMICDWIGVGKAITGKNNIKEWWGKTKDKKKMNDKTFTKIDNKMKGLL
jgi:hypothetical protein